MWLSLLSLWMACNPAPDPCETVGNGLGDCAPALELPLAEGSMWSLAAQDNQVVLVQLTAAWCGTCQQQAPQHQDLFEELGPDGFVPVTVLKGDANFESAGQEDAQAWVDHFGLTHPVVYDEDRVAWKTWKRDVNSLPQLFLIDGKGAIRWRKIGRYDAEEFREVVEEQIQFLD